MHFTEYDTRLAAYAVIVSEQGEILLTWFNGQGGARPGWSLPGGGVEFDETLTQAVEREVLEESGYRVEVGALLADHHFTVKDHPRGRPLRSQRFLYAATIVGGELGTLEVGGSTDFARWVPLDQVGTGTELTADIVLLAADLVRSDGETMP